MELFLVLSTLSLGEWDGSQKMKLDQAENGLPLKVILFAANIVSSVNTPNIVRCTESNFPKLKVSRRKLDFAFKTQLEVDFG